jgi:hypothetical protein
MMLRADIYKNEGLKAKLTVLFTAIPLSAFSQSYEFSKTIPTVDVGSRLIAN